MKHKLFQYLYEMPKFVRNLDVFHEFYDTTYNLRLFHKLDTAEKTIFRKFNDNVIAYNSGFKYFCLNHETKQVVMYLEHIKDFSALVGKQYVVPKVVWLDSNYSQQLKDLISDIYLQILLVKHGAVMTDYQQSVRGKQLWFKLLGDTIGQFPTYIIDFGNRKVMEIGTYSDLQSYDIDDIFGVWSDNKRHEHIRLLISSTKLNVPVQLVTTQSTPNMRATHSSKAKIAAKQLHNQKPDVVNYRKRMGVPINIDD